MNEKIVMIHGMWGGAWYWENFKHFFNERGYECLTPVLRHHDTKPMYKPHPELGATSLLDYAQDLEVYLREFDTKPYLMGHSMGGLLAQILAARGLAKGLILLAPAAPGGVSGLTFSVIKSFWSLFAKWGFWRNPHRLTFNEASYSMMHLLPEDEQKEFYNSLVWESGRAAAETGFWMFDSKGASKVQESQVNCPVLIISGTEDRIVPSSVVRKVAKKYKAVSTYKEFENHAHLTMLEPGWEEVAEFVSNWLDQVLDNK